MSQLYVHCLLAVLFWAGVNATGVTIQTNVDTREPTVVRSPPTRPTIADDFGWSAIFHQIEEVDPSTDGMGQTLNKTR